MPPVLGPVSPSPMRLWSCAAASGMAWLPSQRAKKRELFAFEKLFDDDLFDGVPSSSPEKHLGGGGFGLVGGFADDDAFAGGESVGLDDDGDGEEAELFADVVERGADGVVGGGNVVALHEVFGEGLAGLELAAAWVGPKTRKPRLLELVDEAEGERQFGADDGEVGLLAFGDARAVRRGFRPIDGDAAGEARRCRRCRGRRRFRRHVEIARARGAESVFAAAAADDENFHFARLISPNSFRDIDFDTRVNVWAVIRVEGEVYTFLCANRTQSVTFRARRGHRSCCRSSSAGKCGCILGQHL